MLPDLSFNDLVQRYKDSYLEVSKAGVRWVDRVSAISRELIQLRESGIHDACDVSIVREFPSMGLVNFEGNVHIVSRQPLRQWCRGLKPALIFDVCRNRNVKLFHVSLNKTAADALFNRVWIPFKEGVDSLRHGVKCSFAINNKYWFSGNSKHIYVWRNKVCVGELLGNQVFFFSESSLLQEEIYTDLKGLNAHF